MILGLDFGGTSYQVFTVILGGKIIGHGNTVCKAIKDANETIKEKQFKQQQVAFSKRIFIPDAPQSRF